MDQQAQAYEAQQQQAQQQIEAQQRQIEALQQQKQQQPEPHQEDLTHRANQICRTQKTGNINGRGISETQDGLVIKDLNYKR